jgi:glutamate-5-semialdehyde dehydrogenase
MEDVKHSARELALRARGAARKLAQLDRTEAVKRLASDLRDPKFVAQLEKANAADVEDARRNGQTAALLDRLTFGGARLNKTCDGVLEVAALPDPVGEVVERTTRPNGLLVERVRAPLGTVLMIYEARPNVTVDAAALCLKSGNACLLRGGSEARRSNEALCAAISASLSRSGLPADSVLFVPPDRALLDGLLQLDDLIDLCIPRGGPSLIRFIAERSRVPVIKHYQGVCHVYVAADADLDLAEKIAVNAKSQRPGVCNAAECLLVDAAVAERALPRLLPALAAKGVELRADERSRALLGKEAASRLGSKLVAAQPNDFGTEFLDLIMAVAVVEGLEGALAHIARYGSNHTEAIVTRDAALGERFLREVDASCAVVNASTRFNDGGELGLGAEIGISTSKLHAYGPMGLRELTTTRFLVRGAGQVRM